MKGFWLILGLILVGCEGGEDTVPAACSAMITWEAPTETYDGTPISTTDLSKYTIYMSEQPEVDEHYIELVVDVTDVNMIMMELKNISPGEHWFYLTVTDVENRISPYSNVLGKQC